MGNTKVFDEKFGTITSISVIFEVYVCLSTVVQKVLKTLPNYTGWPQK